MRQSVLSYYYSKSGDSFLEHLRIDARKDDDDDFDISNTTPFLKGIRCKENVFLLKLGIRGMYEIFDSLSTDDIRYWLTGIDIDITDENGIDSIDKNIYEMSGNLIIDSASFSNFGRLLWKVGGLTISDKCISIRQVDNIAWVSGDIDIAFSEEHANSISDNYLSSMEHMGGTLTITAPESGCGIRTLGNLQYINKDMRLTNCTKLTKCHARLNVDGTVYLKNCTQELADILSKNKNTVVIL